MTSEEQIIELVKNSTPETKIRILDALQVFRDQLFYAEEVIPKDTLLKDEGKTYRCSCGCNVFRPLTELAKLKNGYKAEEKVYQCNGCREWVSGE